MKLLILLFLFLFVTVSEASIVTFFQGIPLIGTLFGGKKHTEITTDIGKKEIDVGELEGNIEKNKIKVNILDRAFKDWKNDFEINFEANVKAIAKIEAVAEVKGYDKSQKLEAGRDAISIKKNDAKVIIYIAAGLFGFMGLVFTGLVSIIGLQIKNKHKLEMQQAKEETEIVKLKEHLSNEQIAKNKYKQIVEQKLGVIRG